MSTTETSASHARRHRVKVESVLQLEATECGAACLGMVLGHYGKFVPLEQLRIACGVSRDGANAANLVKAARSYGLTTVADKREPEELKSMTFPLIVHWRFFHFVVVEGWYPGGWYINDPALGPRGCDADEFDRYFTGIAMQLTPGPDFKPSGRRPGVAGRLIKAGGHVRPAVLIAALIALLLLVPTLLIPQVISLYSNGLIGAVGLTATVAVIGLLVAIVIQGVLLIVQGSLSVRFATKISVRLASSMVYQLLRLPAAFHAQRGASVMAQRALLADNLSQGVSAVTVTAAAGLLTSGIGALVLLRLNWPAGLVAIALGLTTGIVVRATLRRSRDEAAKVVVQTVEAGASISVALNQIESIKASGTEDGVIARGLAAQYRLVEAQQRVATRSMLLKVLPGLLGAMSTILVALVAAWGVKAGLASPGTFIATLALAAIVVAPISQIIIALEQAQTLRASLDQVDDVLDTEIDPELVQEPPSDAPTVIKGALSVSDVSFGYSKIKDPLIKDFSLSIAPGHRVALVGPSGCGKSTVSRLLTGLYEPWSGEIRIDGRTRLEHRRAVLTEYMALVDQEVSIFAGSIRDNVTLWDHTIPDEDVIAAIRDAQLEDVLAQRPGGLDAELREGGADLSGGQRQRLEIARALVRNPSILVLDEATSSLDPATEQLIDQALRRRGITCVVIAHRLSTIRDCDEIVVMSRGLIVERGTHDTLMALGGHYSALVGSA